MDRKEPRNDRIVFITIPVYSLIITINSLMNSEYCPKKKECYLSGNLLAYKSKTYKLILLEWIMTSQAKTFSTKIAKKHQSFTAITED